MTKEVFSSEKMSKMIKSFNVFIGIGFIASSLIFVPYIFDGIFSFDGILQIESKYLWSASAGFLLSGILFLILKSLIKGGFAMTAFSILFVVWIELWFRLFVNIIASPQFISELSSQSNITYADQSAYKGSPFIHFTGRSNVELKGSDALRGSAPFNNYGFSGREMFQYKPRNVIRIACLGESTTADGYPTFLENYLNVNKGQGELRFEVYNFGHAYWTSANSLTNFVLNVRDFQPDIVVIHHGWNEEKIRNVPDSIFRNDYSHVLKSFEVPFVYDRYLLRVSGLYRYFKFKYDKSPEWTNLASSVQQECIRTTLNYANLNELLPFERNIKSIIDLAVVDSIQIVIATLPHSTDPSIPLYYAYKNIDQCNDITRRLHFQYPQNSLLVDLDSLITGKFNDIFTDLGHVNDNGRLMKAEFIGKAILGYLKSHDQSLGLNWSDKYVMDGMGYYHNMMLQNKEWLTVLQRDADSMGVNLETVMSSHADYMHNITDKIPE